MEKRVGIIGWGKMGSCLGEALEEVDFSVYAYDKDKDKLKGVKKINVKNTSSELIESVPILILAVKPQDIKDLLEEIREYLVREKPLLITIAAGVSTSFFEQTVEAIRVIRVMPNLAAKVKAAVSFICKGKYAQPQDLAVAKEIFAAVGKVFVVEESLLDKVTSISGSGPGYIYYFMNCIYKAAVQLGFAEEVAKQMVKQTLWGAAKLAEMSSKDFAVLTGEVASPKGTTEAGLKVFSQAKVEEIVLKAVISAYKRAQELNLKS